MKKLIIILFVMLLTFLISLNVKANLPLSGKLIVIDPGHGGKDPGTVYGGVLEKDINLHISLFLEAVLSKKGASVILTRDGDYDLSSPNVHRRKQSDFDNRIRLINNSKADLYLSIHINYLEDSQYKGGQVFYLDENKNLAEYIQAELNKISDKRNIKTMPNIYMYKRLTIPGVLVECGFISNSIERKNLVNKNYQLKVATAITDGLINYLNK